MDHDERAYLLSRSSTMGHGERAYLLSRAPAWRYASSTATTFDEAVAANPQFFQRYPLAADANTPAREAFRYDPEMRRLFCIPPPLPAFLQIPQSLRPWFPLRGPVESLPAAVLREAEAWFLHPEHGPERRTHHHFPIPQHLKVPESLQWWFAFHESRTYPDVMMEVEAFFMDPQHGTARRSLYPKMTPFLEDPDNPWIAVPVPRTPSSSHSKDKVKPPTTKGKYESLSARGGEDDLSPTPPEVEPSVEIPWVPKTVTLRKSYALRKHFRPRNGGRQNVRKHSQARKGGGASSVEGYGHFIYGTYGPGSLQFY